MMSNVSVKFLNHRNPEQAKFRWAILYCNHELVEKMIKVNNKLKDDVLHIAAYIGYVETLKHYINSGMNVNKKGRGKIFKNSTPLRMAVMNRQYAAVKYLIEAGANVKIIKSGKCHGGCSILHTALSRFRCYPCWYDNLKLFLSHNANVNHTCGRCQTPLAIAITNGTVKLVEMFLEYGADVKAVHLHLAVTKNQPEILKLLLDHSTDVNALFKGKSIIYNINPFENNVTDLFNILIAGFDLNLIDINDLMISMDIKRIVAAVDRLFLDVSLIGIFFKTIVEHLAKMKAAGFYLNGTNSKILNDEKLDEFYASCCKDIELMKKSKIAHTRVSFYDLFLTNEYTIASKIKCVTKKNVLNYWKEFPMYCEIVDYKLNRVFIRQRWLEKVNYFLDNVFWNILPTTFVWNISSYFCEIYVKELSKKL